MYGIPSRATPSKRITGTNMLVIRLTGKRNAYAHKINSHNNMTVYKYYHNQIELDTFATNSVDEANKYCETLATIHNIHRSEILMTVQNETK